MITAAALLLSACSEGVPPWREAPWPVKDFDVVTAGQSGCLFNCPAFDVEIFADGRARHSGPTFETTGGPVESRIDPRGLARIAKLLREVRFDDMRDSYQELADGCEDVPADLSTLTFSVKRGDRTKEVHFYAGCTGPNVPVQRINTLIKGIDGVTGTGALLEKQQPRSGPHGERG
jgi:hypothetical protein